MLQLYPDTTVSSPGFSARVRHDQHYSAEDRACTGTKLISTKNKDIHDESFQRSDDVCDIFRISVHRDERLVLCR